MKLTLTLTLTKKIIIGFLTLYIVVVAAAVGISYMNTKEEVYSEIMAQYKEYFRIAEANLDTFFGEIAADLVTLSENPVVCNRNDAEFTSFLNADEKTFQYHYSNGEKDIIKLFNEYRKSHPYVNSVYMGRANGSFVRSHQRTSPTKYDPRERPWYQLAIKDPDKVQLTEAYASVTNADINIGSVLALKDELGGIFGVIGMDVTLDELSNKMEQMVLQYDGHLELWDSNGTVLISPFKKRLNKVGKDIGKQALIKTDKDSRLFKTQSGYMMSSCTHMTTGRLVAYIPSKAVDKAIYDDVRNSVFLITLVMVLAFLLTYLLVETLILYPLRKMQSSLNLSRFESTPHLMDIKATGELKAFEEDYNKLIKAIDADKTELEKIKLLTISSLASLAEIRDYETGLHIVRTQKYVELLAIAYNLMNPGCQIPERKLSIMVQCAPLHDIGKVAIPDNILLKPGVLDHQEFELMKKHTVYGRDSFRKSDIEINDSEFIKTAVNIVYHHHERWDGNGYPEGLKEQEIPIEARIMAVADVYDALTTKRVYKDSVSHEQAVHIILEGDGTQFDPEIIKAFLKVKSAFEDISKLYCEK